MALEIDLPLTSDAEADAEAAGLAAEVTDLGTERFLHAVLARPARIHHRSTERLIGLPTGVPAVAEPSSSLLLRALHLCFAAHLPLSLSPDVLWYTVVHESAVHVRLNADRYAHLFTDTPGYTRTIVVRDDAAPADWERSIRRVREPLHRNLGEATTELFLPPFSTTTPTDTAAALVALMDVVSPYYRFRWVTMCGIPRVRLEGTPEDWQLLADRTRALGERLTGLRPWLAGLLPVLDEIAATAAGRRTDEQFWRSLYSWESASGGDTVTGWITAFLAHRYTDDGPVPKEAFGRTETDAADLPAHVSRVPFRWETPLGTCDMAFLGGVLGIERDGEWVRPRLGVAVAELLAARTEEDLPLPEEWTLADVRRLTGCPDARVLDPLGRVTVRGTPITADLAIEWDGLCAVRDADGGWHLGDLVSAANDVSCWRSTGPDLADALRLA
ncbi:DUF4419 domain-containing protein [Kitasatospora arboriphila]|uniref:DUF4419 domain-containing protein n=1 Tax=Kitasatospora arboriphila TaxID=258052 RepID=A0ABP4E5X7_9ACTN